MKFSLRDVILGLTLTLVGAVVMVVGLFFSETVNLISVLGIILGTQTIAMGQLLTLRAVRTIRRQANQIIKDETLTGEAI